jgi:hypothetical protein
MLALVLGGAAIIFSLIPATGILFGGLFGIAAIVLGVIGVFMSHRPLAVTGIALAVVGLIVAITVSIAVGRPAGEIAGDSPTGSEDRSSEDAESEAKQHLEGVEGTDPNSPLPAGTEVVAGDWRVAFSNVVSDATEAVTAEDEFNEEPAEGHQYFMFQVDATYEGDESGFAGEELLVGVTFNNTVYTEYCGVIPNDFFYTPEVFAGGTVTGNVCVTVPSEGVEDAAISVEDYWAPGHRYFVDAS